MIDKINWQWIWGGSSLNIEIIKDISVLFSWSKVRILVCFDQLKMPDKKKDQVKMSDYIYCAPARVVWDKYVLGTVLSRKAYIKGIKYPNKIICC